MRQIINCLLYEKLCSILNISKLLIDLKNTYPEYEEFSLYGIEICKNNIYYTDNYLELYLCGLIKEDNVLVFLNRYNTSNDLLYFIKYKDFIDALNSKNSSFKIYRMNNIKTKKEIEELICKYIEFYSTELKEINEKIKNKKYQLFI